MIYELGGISRNIGGKARIPSLRSKWPIRISPGLPTVDGVPRAIRSGLASW